MRQPDAPPRKRYGRGAATTSRNGILKHQLATTSRSVLTRIRKSAASVGKYPHVTAVPRVRVPAAAAGEGRRPARGGGGRNLLDATPQRRYGRAAATTSRIGILKHQLATTSRSVLTRN